MGQHSHQQEEEEQEATRDEMRSVAITAVFFIILVLTIFGLLATAVWGVIRLIL